MAKRSTIGENPLDDLAMESPLDAVVPDPLAVPRRPQLLEEEAGELRERLAALEAENQALKAEVARLQAEMARLKEVRAELPEPWWITHLREKLAGK